MATTNLIYGHAILDAFGSVSAGNAPNVDYLSDTINGALVTSTYAPNQDTDEFWSTPVTNELANGNGYTTNGITLTTKTITYVGASNRGDFDADDLSWTFTASKTFRYCVIYDRTPATDATRPVLCYIDFGGDQTLSTAFTIQFSTSPSAIFSITVS